MRVFGDNQSGNCYKVKLLMSLLNIKHEWQLLDILSGETKTSDFLSINPNGKIPVVMFNDGRVLCESNAILGYFAEGTAFLPSGHYEKAKVYEWLFFEQYSHEPYIAVARFIQKYLGLPDDKKEVYLSLQEGGNHALSIMEEQLSRCDFLVENTMSIADVSLYAYTHVADEGGFDLTKYPAIMDWFKRIEALEGYTSIG